MPMPNMTPPTPTIPRPNIDWNNGGMVRPNYVSNTMLPGFFVNSINEIQAKDIPADGSMSFFPFRDLSRIVVKQWSSPSTLETAVYVLESTYPQQNQTQSQQPSLPAPPPPVVQQQSQNQAPRQVDQNMQQQDNALLEGFKQLNNGLAGAFKQLEHSLEAINANLEQLNGRFVDGDSVG